MLISQIEGKGFRQVAMGGNCRALVRQWNNQTDVITGIEGDLPETNNWLLVTYEGDWLQNPDAQEVSIIDSETSPIHLLEALDI